jgi:hypothetical protein
MKKIEEAKYLPKIGSDWQKCYQYKTYHQILDEYQY